MGGVEESNIKNEKQTKKVNDNVNNNKWWQQQQ